MLMEFDSHLTWALCCIVVAMLVAILLLADAIAAYRRALQDVTGRRKKWWQK
jgi:hypothetical protein